ncbi:MAG: hypothetical protein ACREQK_16500, partial [Candidatus Binatia bacterium]
SGRGEPVEPRRTQSKRGFLIQKSSELCELSVSVVKYCFGCGSAALGIPPAAQKSEAITKTSDDLVYKIIESASEMEYIAVLESLKTVGESKKGGTERGRF